MPNYKMKASGKTAEILLYDEIGEGWFGGISAKQFAKDLQDLGKIDQINLRINSPGGNVFDGLAMYNNLVRHPANVTVDIDGMALSIASVIAMAGNEINMADNAMLMIHDPWMVAAGTADDFRDQADLMDSVKENLVTTYAARSGLERQVVSDLMKEETWMNADEAFANGFINAITPSLAMAASFDLSRFRHVPRALAAASKASGTPRYDMARARLAAMEKRCRELGHGESV